MKPVILIGGPADGRRDYISDDVRYVSVPIIESMTGDIDHMIGVAHYHVRELRGEKKSFHVGFCEGSLDDCLLTILRGYKPVKGEEHETGGGMMLENKPEAKFCYRCDYDCWDRIDESCFFTCAKCGKKFYCKVMTQELSERGANEQPTEKPTARNQGS